MGEGNWGCCADGEVGGWLCPVVIPSEAEEAPCPSTLALLPSFLLVFPLLPVPSLQPHLLSILFPLPSEI